MSGGNERTDQGGGTGAAASLYGEGRFSPLSETRQTTSALSDGDGSLTVFDHPFADTPGRISNQGSAFPNGPQGTCGCCACGTVINKAGGNTNERAVVEYAMENGLCSKDGGTSPESWAGILAGAGIPASIVSNASLEDLAAEVERGKGVVIGVSACTYNRKKYGVYLPGMADGHAIVLESVIRDRETGKIVEYVISDSNGSCSADACIRVSPRVLSRAFRRKGRSAVVTDSIIW